MLISVLSFIVGLTVLDCYPQVPGLFLHQWD